MKAHANEENRADPLSSSSRHPDRGKSDRCARALFAASGLVVLFLAPSNLHAQYLSDAYTARGLAMGGATRANPGTSSALELNPALLSLVRTHLSETDYRLFRGESAHSFRLAFIDGLTSKLASGISIDFGTASGIPGPEKVGWSVLGESSQNVWSYRGQGYRLGAAYPIAEKVAAGLTLVWHAEKSDDAQDIRETQLSSHFTVNAGTLFLPVPNIYLALAGSNLVPTGLPDLPTTLSGGIRASAGTIATGTADVVVNLTGMRDLLEEDRITADNVVVDVHLGGQVLVGKYFPLRFGFYTERQYSARYLTLGGAIESGTSSLTYGMRYLLVAEDGTGAAEGRFYHMFSIGLSFGK